MELLYDIGLVVLLIKEVDVSFHISQVNLYIKNRSFDLITCRKFTSHTYSKITVLKS